MTRNTAPTRKPSGRAAVTPRQIALVVPHAAPVAGSDFESAMELLSSDLEVHALWHEERGGKPRRRAKRAGPAS